MVFHFALDAVLRYREGLERREYLVLEHMNQELAKLRADLQKTERLLRDYDQSRVQELRQGVRAIHLHVLLEQTKRLVRYGDELRHQIQEQGVRVRQQLELYLGARRKRETLAELRKSQLAAHRREESRQEQRAMDEMFLQRMRHK